MMEEPSAKNATYPPSWANRFTFWVNRLPGPAWLFYVVLLIVWELIAFLLFSATGELQLGEVGPAFLLYNFWGVAILGFHHYLDHEIRGALHDSRPMLNVSSAGFSKLEHDFTIMPARPFLAWSMVGLGFGALASVYEGGYIRFTVPVLANMLGFGVVTALLFGISYRLLRFLRMVSELYTSSISINLLDLAPVYVFSTLCSKVGLFLLVLLYSSLLVEPESLADPFFLGGYALLSIIPLAAFFLPLRGINRRLVNEKRELLSEVSQRLEIVFDQIRKAFESGNLNNMGDLEIALRTVKSEKDLVEKIPTWPWRPATLRVFLSAVFLPILLWLIQQVLVRLVDL